MWGSVKTSAGDWTRDDRIGGMDRTSGHFRSLGSDERLPTSLSFHCWDQMGGAGENGKNNLAFVCHLLGHFYGKYA